MHNSKPLTLNRNIAESRHDMAPITDGKYSVECYLDARASTKVSFCGSGGWGGDGGVGPDPQPLKPYTKPETRIPIPRSLTRLRMKTTGLVQGLFLVAGTRLDGLTPSCHVERKRIVPKES